MSAATPRHPTSPISSETVATMMNGVAIPLPVIARSPIPTTRAAIHTGRPVRTSAQGRFQPRTVAQPAAAPARNGQAVCSTPNTVMSSECAPRPIQAKSRITMTSIAAAEMIAPRDAGREVCERMQLLYESSTLGGESEGSHILTSR